MVKQRRGEVGGLLYSYLWNMARLLWVIGLVGCSAAAQAQQDSTRTLRLLWVEATLGFNSPSGHAGLGVGVPVSHRLCPVIAAGFGGTEGKHLSTGIEYTAFRVREIDLSAFGYWTWTTGRHNDKYSIPKFSTTSGAGEMLKFGASVTQNAGAVLFCLRAGYGWYIKAPVTQDASGAIGMAQPSRTLNDGPVLGFGIRVPIGHREP